MFLLIFDNFHSNLKYVSKTNVNYLDKITLGYNSQVRHCDYCYTIAIFNFILSMPSRVPGSKIR